MSWYYGPVIRGMRVVWPWVIAAWCGAVCAACNGSAPDRTTPRGALAAVQRCVDAADTRCLYWRLHEETRWRFSTIHTYLSESVRLIRSDYPADTRLSAVLGAWADAADAPDGPAVFAAYCRRTGCMDTLVRSWGPPRTIQVRGDTAQVVTVRGGRFTLRRNASGTWGLELDADTLLREQIRLRGVRDQVRANARDYRLQRRAVADTAAPGEQETR